jgi:allophanate hydrolase
MVALPALDEEGGRPAVPPRPGLVRDPAGGEALEVEIYELPVSAVGRLLLTVAPPLAIGTVALADGGAAPGFVCEGYAAGSVPDISAYGGWRGYLAARVTSA